MLPESRITTRQSAGLDVNGWFIRPFWLSHAMAPVLLVPRTEGGQAPSDFAAWVASGAPGGHLEWDGENGEDGEDGEDGENRRTPHAAPTLSHRTKPTYPILPYPTASPLMAPAESFPFGYGRPRILA